jgi:hypothetical protein
VGRLTTAVEETRRPTMNDVARAAGVSLKTVSRVINDDPTVQREYVESVHAAVSVLGFRRNEIARTFALVRRRRPSDSSSKTSRTRSIPRLRVRSSGWPPSIARC